jgi:hypothetical protein
MTVVDIPNEVCNIIQEYIIHPDDFFNLKSTCNHWNSQLTSCFSFKNIEHVASCKFRRSQKYKKVSMTARPYLCDIPILVHIHLIPSRLAFAVCGSISDEEIEKLPVYWDYWGYLAEGFMREGRDVVHVLEKAAVDLHRTQSADILLSALKFSCPEDSCVRFLKMYISQRHSEETRLALMELAIRRNYNTFLTHLQLSAPVNLNLTYSGGYLLHHACSFGSLDSLLILVLLGACPKKMRYRYGWNPLPYIAALRGDLEMLVLLKAIGCDFKERSFHGTDITAVTRKRILEVNDPVIRSKLISCLNFVSLVVSYFDGLC